MRKLSTAESSYFDPGTMNSREAPFFLVLGPQTLLSLSVNGMVIEY